jgi:hypothetical protein
MRKSKSMLTGALVAAWIATAAMLNAASGVRSAHATIDCEEYPELCSPPSCPNTECVGISGCGYMSGIVCSMAQNGSSCSNTACGAS